VMHGSRVDSFISRLSNKVLFLNDSINRDHIEDRRKDDTKHYILSNCTFIFIWVEILAIRHILFYKMLLHQQSKRPTSSEVF